MSDDGLKGAASSVAQDLGESVVKPVVEELGRSLEQGIQTIISGPPPNKPATPPVTQQKQADEAQRKAWAESVIKRYQKIEEEVAKVRAEKAKQLQASQQQEVQKKEESKFQAFEQKKQLAQDVALAQRKTEIKKGVGG